MRRLQRIRVSVRTFGIDVNQTHLHGGERFLEIAAVNFSVSVVVGDGDAAFLHYAFRSVGVANVAAEPGLLGAPEIVLIWCPSVLASTTEAESFEAHCF